MVVQAIHSRRNSGCFERDLPVPENLMLREGTGSKGGRKRNGSPSTREAIDKCGPTIDVYRSRADLVVRFEDAYPNWVLDKGTKGELLGFYDSKQESFALYIPEEVNLEKHFGSSNPKKILKALQRVHGVESIRAIDPMYIRSWDTKGTASGKSKVIDFIDSALRRPLVADISRQDPALAQFVMDSGDLDSLVRIQRFMTGSNLAQRQHGGALSELLGRSLGDLDREVQRGRSGKRSREHLDKLLQSLEVAEDAIAAASEKLGGAAEKAMSRLVDVAERLGRCSINQSISERRKRELWLLRHATQHAENVVKQPGKKVRFDSRDTSDSKMAKNGNSKVACTVPTKDFHQLLFGTNDFDAARNTILTFYTFLDHDSDGISEYLRDCGKIKGLPQAMKSFFDTVRAEVGSRENCQVTPLNIQQISEGRLFDIFADDGNKFYKATVRSKPYPSISLECEYIGTSKIEYLRMGINGGVEWTESSGTNKMQKVLTRIPLPRDTDSNPEDRLKGLLRKAERLGEDSFQTDRFKGNSVGIRVTPQGNDIFLLEIEMGFGGGTELQQLTIEGGKLAELKRFTVKRSSSSDNSSEKMLTPLPLDDFDPENGLAFIYHLNDILARQLEVSED